jgi:hypothetical protein
MMNCITDINVALSGLLSENSHVYGKILTRSDEIFFAENTGETTSAVTILFGKFQNGRRNGRHI